MNPYQTAGAEHPSATWTQEKRDVLAAMLRSGSTASQIGAHFGVSKNAVIGIVGRDKTLKAIGFARRAGDSTGIKRKFIAASAGNRLKTVRGGIISKNQLKTVPAPIIAKPAPSRPVTVPHHVGRPLEMLPACRCKFAITPHDAPKDAHLFCGEVTEIGKSWCAWHERIVWGRGTAAQAMKVAA